MSKVSKFGNDKEVSENSYETFLTPSIQLGLGGINKYVSPQENTGSSYKSKELYVKTKSNVV